MVYWIAIVDGPLFAMSYGGTFSVVFEPISPIWATYTFFPASYTFPTPTRENPTGSTRRQESTSGRNRQGRGGDGGDGPRGARRAEPRITAQPQHVEQCKSLPTRPCICGKDPVVHKRRNRAATSGPPCRWGLKAKAPPGVAIRTGQKDRSYARACHRRRFAATQKHRKRKP